MATPLNPNDPRVKRTRQLLLQAFVALVEETHDIPSISVQEITERATVNRATFYAHFEDKYALLECWMRAKFHRALQSQLPDESTLQMDSLRELILAVFRFLATFRGYMKPPNKQFEPLFEVALQRELYEVLLNWLNKIPAHNFTRQRPRQTTAMILSWAIFGSALQWSRGEQTSSVEEMTDCVLEMVVASLSPVFAVT